LRAKIVVVQRERRRELEKLKIRLEELGHRRYCKMWWMNTTKAVERDAFLEREIHRPDDFGRRISKVSLSELNTELHEQFVTGIEKIYDRIQSVLCADVWWGKCDTQAGEAKR
jgi:hypothetical protein